MNLDYIAATQSSKEITANALFEAAAGAIAFARRAAGCVGLTWAFYGADAYADGAVVSTPNGSLVLNTSASNFIELDPAARTVSSNTSGFTAGRVPLYIAVAGAASVTSYVDVRSTLALAAAGAGGGSSTSLQISKVSSSYSLVVADAGKVIRVTADYPVNINVPTQGAQAFKIGDVVLVRQSGAGQVTISPSLFVTINATDSLVTRKQFSEIRLHKVAGNEWDLTGDTQ